jgi:hypothetical protein
LFVWIVDDLLEMSESSLHKKTEMGPIEEERWG